MKITTIEFTLSKTTPLEPLSGNEADRYANVKPAARVVIAIDIGDDLDTAFKWARGVCFEQLVEFHEQLVAALR